MFSIHKLQFFSNKYLPLVINKNNIAQLSCEELINMEREKPLHHKLMYGKLTATYTTDFPSNYYDRIHRDKWTVIHSLIPRNVPERTLNRFRSIKVLLRKSDWILYVTEHNVHICMYVHHNHYRMLWS